MESSGRWIPPGRGRIAAAWRAGALGGSSALTAGFVLLASSAALYLLGAWEAQSLTELVRGGVVTALASGSTPTDLPNELIAVWLKHTWPFLAVSFAAALAASLLPAARYLGRRGRTAVPLPVRPWTGAYVPVLRLFCLLLFLALAAYVLRERIGAAFSLPFGDRDAGRRLGSAGLGLVSAAGFVAVLCSLAEVSINRYFAWRSLHLNSAEARRELRAAGGDRAVRAEQRRRSGLGAQR